MQRIDELLAAIQEHGNPVVRASAVELVRALLAAHRAGLAEMLAHIERYGESGQAIVHDFVADDLVCSLLLLHGLHPVSLETRVRKVLNEVQPVLDIHDAEVRLEIVTHDAIRLHVKGGGQVVHTVLEQALLAAAPDVLRFEFVDAESRLVSLPLVQGG
jgi:hypothetical protein